MPCFPTPSSCLQLLPQDLAQAGFKVLAEKAWGGVMFLFTTKGKLVKGQVKEQ